MTIDMKKQYRTRDGREVRIYAVDGGLGHDAVHGAVRDSMGVWTPYAWYSSGSYLGTDRHDLDIIAVRPRIKREVWVNVYPDENTHWVMHLTKESADRQAMPNRIACVKLTIDCEEGEGIDR